MPPNSSYFVKYEHLHVKLTFLFFVSAKHLIHNNSYISTVSAFKLSLTDG